MSSSVSWLRGLSSIDRNVVAPALMAGISPEVPQVKREGGRRSGDPYKIVILGRCGGRKCICWGKKGEEVASERERVLGAARVGEVRMGRGVSFAFGRWG